MASKTSFFNKTIFRETLRRYWAVFAVYAFALIAAIPLDMILPKDPSSLSASFYATQFPLIRAWHFGLILSFVMAAAVVMILFGYLYSSRQNSLYASLPVTRNTLFCTLVCASLTGLLAANILTAVLVLVAQIILGSVSLMTVGKVLLTLILMNLVFFGFALFCGMLTGSIFIMPLVYAVLSVAAFGYSLLLGVMASKLIFGVSLAETPTMYLSPLLMLMRSGPDPYYTYMESYGEASMDWRMLILYALAGLAFIVLAWLLYRKRRAETVSDTVSFPILKPLFRICMTLGCALLLSLGSEVMSGMAATGVGSGFARILVLTLLGGILGYYLAEVIIRKSFRVITRQSLTRCGILTVLLAVMLFGYRYDWFHVASRIPPLEKIQSVQINYSGPQTPLYGSEVDQINITDPDTIELCREAHRSILDHREIHRNAPEAESHLLYLDYALKNGRVMSRSYYLDPATEEGKADSEWMGEVINSRSFLQNRKERLIQLLQDPKLMGLVDYYLPETEDSKQYQLSTDQLQDLVVNCLIPDLEDSTILNYYLDDEEYCRDVTTWTIELTKEDASGSYEYAFISVPADAARCMQWIQSNLGLTPHSIAEANQNMG